MKKIIQVLLILLILSIASVIVRQYKYEKITPKALGDHGFPLKEEWSLCIGDKIQEISTDGNQIIIVKTNKELSAYDLVSGDLIWITPLKNQVESFPAITAGRRVFVSDNENLWAFDLITGKILWKNPLEDNVKTWISDASDKFVLLNSISDRVFVFDAKSGKRLWETQGARGWTQAHIYGEKVFIVDYGVKAFDATTGRLLWELSNNSTTTGLSVMGNEILYFMEFPDSEGFDLVAYNTTIEKELWRRSFVDNSPKRLYVYDDVLFLPQNNALYQLNTKTGEINWIKQFSDPTNLSVIDGSIYVLEQFNRIIHVLNIKSGEELGSLQVSTPRVLGTETQEMISTETSLVFSRGCEIFVYRN
jgi:outer membrane protein assembly factor BamB